MHRPVAGLGVVLRDADKEKRGHHAHNAAAQQPPTALQHVVNRRGKAHQRQQRGHVITAIQRIHRILIFAAMHHQHAHKAGHQVDGVHHQRKEDPLDAEDRIESRAQNHGADVFRRRGLKDVRATAGAIAHVVAHQVRNHRGIARIVFRDAGLHLAHQVRAYVGSLGVDAAAQLGEERHQRSAKAKADQLIRNVLRIRQSAKKEEQAAHSEQREADDHHAGDRTPVQRDLQGLAQAGTGSTGGANIGTNGDEHAGVAGKTGADGADQEADHHLARQRSRKVRKLVAHKEGNSQHHGQRGDGRVLARHECFRTFADGVRNHPHLRRPGIKRQYRPGQKKGKNQAEQAGKHCDPQKCAATGVGGRGQALS